MLAIEEKKAVEGEQEDVVPDVPTLISVDI
jgi:hypothetical protein